MSTYFAFENVNFVGHPMHSELRNKDLQLGGDVGDMDVANMTCIHRMCNTLL